MATYVKDGVRITMTAQELAAWNAMVAARPPRPPRQKPKLEKLADLMVSKNLLTQADIDGLDE